MPETISNHVQLALNRLIQQYKNSNRVKGLLTALVTPIQDLEGTFQDLKVDRWLDVAEGVILDRIGNLIGVTRTSNESDTSYRVRIQTQILVNISNGEPESAIQVFKRYTNATTVLYSEGKPASVQLQSEVEIETQELINQIYEEIERVVPAGVRVDAICRYSSLSESFAFDGSLPGKGFGSIADSSQGGEFAEVYRYTGVEFSFGSTQTDEEDLTGGGFGTLEDSRIGGVFVGI